MGQMIGRNGSKQMAVVVVLIVSVDGAFVQPRKVIDQVDHQLIAFINLLQNFPHGAGGVLWVFDAGFEDVQNSFGFGQHVSHSPLVASIELDVYPVFVLFVDVVEVGLSVVVVDVGDGLEMVLSAASEIDFAVNVSVHLHFL